MGRGVRGAAVVALLGVSLVACTEPVTRTRLTATIDADFPVRLQVADIDARIEVRTSSNTWKLVEPARLEPRSSSDWPLKFTTNALDDEVGATYQLRASARDSRDAVLAQASVVATFEQSQHDALSILFDQGCLRRDPPCGPGMTCRDGACVDPTFDPKAQRRRPAEAAPDAGDGDPTSPQPNPNGIAEENAACANEGELRCNGALSLVPLRCEQATWKRQTECAETERCATSGGQRGTCQKMAPECASQKPGIPFCRNEVMLACDADLRMSRPLQCESDRRCATDATGGARCACVAGLVESDGACEAAKSCGGNNGGCDALTTCSQSQSGPTCGPCPSGFSGTGATGCVPRLKALDTTTNVLSPAFSPETTEYQIDVPLLVQRVTLSAQGPAGTSVSFNGASVAGSPLWTSPVLALGDTALEVRVQTNAGVGTAYRIHVKRGGKQAAYIKPSTTKAGMYFASWMALSGETLLVGAPFENSSATGINGDEKNTGAADSGAAYVFVRTPQGWIQQAYLKSPTETQAGDFFGGAVAISGDTLVIGAVRRDLRNQFAWPDRKGVVFVYTRSGNVWSLQKELSAGDATVGDSFGYSLALDGDALAVGAPIVGPIGEKYGAVYTFNRTAGMWQQSQKLESPRPDDLGQFGSFLSMADGSLVVSAQEDSNDAEQGGAVYVFTRRDSLWENPQRLAPQPVRAKAWFGFETAVFGDELVVGAPSVDDPTRTDEHDGEAWVYQRRGDRWEQTTVLTAPLAQRGNLYGTGVAIAKDALLISAIGENGGSTGVGGDPNRRDAPETGAAYLYARTDDGWKLSTYFKANNPGRADVFGWMVGLGPDFAVVIAPREDGGGSGINPADNNSSNDSGAVYVFQ